VATKKANSWGLFDMAGNVSEWCHETYKKDLGSSAVTDPCVFSAGSPYRMARGGGYFNAVDAQRAAFRNDLDHKTKYSVVGFRCIRTIQ